MTKWVALCWFWSKARGIAYERQGKEGKFLSALFCALSLLPSRLVSLLSEDKGCRFMFVHDSFLLTFAGYADEVAEAIG